MSSLLAKLRVWLAGEPMLTAWVVNGGLAAFLAFALHFTRIQEAAAATIITGLAAAYSAFRTRPPSVGALVGALATAVTAAAAFGLHISPETLGAGEALASTVLGLLFRANVTPAVKMRPAPVDTVWV